VLELLLSTGVEDLETKDTIVSAYKSSDLAKNH